MEEISVQIEVFVIYARLQAEFSGMRISIT